MVEIQRTSAFFFVLYGTILMLHKHVLTVLGKKQKEFSKRKWPVITTQPSHSALATGRSSRARTFCLSHFYTQESEWIYSALELESVIKLTFLITYFRFSNLISLMQQILMLIYLRWRWEKMLTFQKIRVSVIIRFNKVTD